MIVDTDAGRRIVNNYSGLGCTGIPPLSSIDLNDCYTFSWILYANIIDMESISASDYSIWIGIGI